MNQDLSRLVKLLRQGPISIYRYPNLVNELKMIQADTDIDREYLDLARRLISEYLWVQVPYELVVALKDIQKAKPFEVDIDMRKRLLDVCRTIIRKRRCAEEALANDIADEIFKLVHQHIKYDRELIIRQLDHHYTYDFTWEDFHEYDKLLRLDNKITHDFIILGQRARIIALMHLRREELEEGSRMS